MMTKLLFIALLCFAGTVHAEFYGGAKWVYLKPTASDGDLEFGSDIRLSPQLEQVDDPFVARLLQLQPDYTSGYELTLGYLFPCTCQNVELKYFSLESTTSKSVAVQDPIPELELIQNFLGGNYSTAHSKAKHEIRTLDLTYGMDFCFNIHPYIGLKYADIRRDRDVSYTNVNRIPPENFVVGTTRSKYWGVGPVLGSDLSIPFFCHLQAVGKCGGALLLGCNTSNLDSSSFFFPNEKAFNASSERYRTVPALNWELAINYVLPFSCQGSALELEAGYRGDYYFKPIDRINPHNGYIVQSSTFPEHQTSNLALHGPYVSLLWKPGVCFGSTCDYECGSSLGFHLKNGWLKPCPSNDDLAYAILHTGGDDQIKKISPDYAWSGTYTLDYRFCGIYDVEATYFRLATTDSASTDAKPGEALSSLSASGPGGNTFTQATSQVKYEIDQLDVSLGREMMLCCPLTFRPSVGLRYLKLDRRLSNVFSGGADFNFRTLLPVIESKYHGIGPLFGLDPTWCLGGGFAVRTSFDVAFLIGHQEATLKQPNISETPALNTNNNLSSRKISAVVPVADASGGLGYTCQWSCFNIDLEAGYQYTEYCRGVNLMYPNFLTGLNQLNSNLRLHGPYLTLGLNMWF